jgi:hypothetical protein
MSDFKIFFFFMLKFLLVGVLTLCVLVTAMVSFFGSLSFIIMFFDSLITNFDLSLLVSILVWIVFVAFVVAIISIFKDRIESFMQKIENWIEK